MSVDPVDKRLLALEIKFELLARQVEALAASLATWEGRTVTGPDAIVGPTTKSPDEA